MPTDRYILGETEAETRRLRAQTHSRPEQRARWAGLRAGMRVVDAGCGPGETSRALASLVGESGVVDAFDASDVRLDSARALAPQPGSASIRFQLGDIRNPPLPEGEYDFVYCQFVLEYLPNPELAVAALTRLLRPGGILCLVDVDNLGSVNWPEPEVVTRGRSLMFEALASTGFDPLVGRKLFHFARQAGLDDVEARVEAVLDAGAASSSEMDNWRQRFVGVAPLAERAFGGPEPYAVFTRAFLAMMADPGAFKLTNIMVARGVRVAN